MKLTRRQLFALATTLPILSKTPILTKMEEEYEPDESIIDLKERLRIVKDWEHTGLLDGTTGYIDRMNLACSLANQIRTDFNSSFALSLVFNIFKDSLHNSFCSLNDLFNLWVLRSPEALIYWHVDGKLRSEAVYGMTMKLKTQFSYDKDLQKQHGYAKYFIDILAQEIKLELFRFCVRTIMKNIEKNGTNKINIKDIKKIVKDRCGVEPTWMLTSPEMAEVLGFKCTTSLMPNLAYMNWEGLKVYVDPLAPTNWHLFGHKSGYFTSGFTFAPYIPLTPIEYEDPMNTNNYLGFTERCGFATRFSYSLRPETSKMVSGGKTFYQIALI